MRNIVRVLLGIMFMFTVLNASESVPTKEEVGKLYVATFNRAPDSAGLTWWTNSSGFKLSQIAQSFFDQDETKMLYPSGTSNRDFVASVYQNLFNREPDSLGWDYWEGELNAGSFSKNRFIEAVINGAQGSDIVILDNKNSVGLAFANAGMNDDVKAKMVMKGITENSKTVDFIKAKILTNNIDDYVWDNFIDWKVRDDDAMYTGNTIDEEIDNGKQEYLFTVIKKAGKKSRAEMKDNNLKFEEISAKFELIGITKKAFSRLSTYKWGVTLSPETISELGFTGTDFYFQANIKMYGKSMYAYIGVGDENDNYKELDRKYFQEYDDANQNWGKTFALGIKKNGEKGSYIAIVDNTSLTLNVPGQYDITVPSSNNGGVAVRGEIYDVESKAGDDPLVFEVYDVEYTKVDTSTNTPSNTTPANSTPLSGFVQNLPTFSNVSFAVYANVSAEYAQMLKVTQYKVPVWYQTSKQSICADNGFNILQGTPGIDTEYKTAGFPEIPYLCDFLDHSDVAGASGDYIVFNVYDPEE